MTKRSNRPATTRPAAASRPPAVRAGVPQVQAEKRPPTVMFGRWDTRLSPDLERVALRALDAGLELRAVEQKRDALVVELIRGGASWAVVATVTGMSYEGARRKYAAHRAPR